MLEIEDKSQQSESPDAYSDQETQSSTQRTEGHLQMLQLLHQLKQKPFSNIFMTETSLCLENIAPESLQLPSSI